jgi:quercetin dioxygenase-like cupin family protein
MKRLMLLALPLLLAGSAAGAKAKPADLKWMDGPPGLPSGSQFAVVAGDPGKKGPFTVHLKFPAGYAVPAHHHPTDENITVLSGKLKFGMGNKADRAKAKWMAKGAKGTAKAGMNHYVFTDAPAEVELKAIGPFAITYADPKDDPRK